MPQPLPQPVRTRIAENLGLVTRAEIVSLGISPRMAEGWVRRGRLEAVQRGVYRIPGAYAPPHQALLATVKRCGPGARADAAASLALHGIEGFRLPEAPGIVIPRPRSMRRTSVDFPVTAIPLPGTDCTRVDGIPALSVTRALIEIAPAVAERTLRVGVDDARRRSLTSLGLLRRRAEALESRKGARIVLRLLRDDTLQAESEGERELLAFLAPLGLELERGVTDVVPGRRLDVFYRPGLVDFEFDGRAHHVLPTDRDSDGLRDLETAERSVLTLRITTGMMRDAPEETRARIARICADRAARLAHERS